MDPLRAGPLPGQRRGQRVAVGRLGSRRALDEPDGLAAGDVDGGQQGEPLAHLISSSQFVSRAAPASPDFSGWNCVAQSAPSSTAARNGWPCSAQVSSG